MQQSNSNLFPAVNCGSAPVVYNASHNIVNGLFGDHVVYECKHGHWFVRDVYQKDTRCTASGTWEPQLKSACTGKSYSITHFSSTDC